MIQNYSDNVTIPENAGPTVLAGRYRIVRKLGQGGMGSVWLAEDTKLDGRKVAIKMLPSILVSNKRAYAQVKVEALVSLKLVHQNIVPVRAFEEEGDSPFLVMDYIEGQTLEDYLAEKGKLTEGETICLLKPVAAALDYAHGQGVVHRDVKPGNVMIAADGHPYVLDFGIAREVQETMTRVTGKLSSGTLMYMSPEQLNGAAPKFAQDVYSFAAMAYECLKGEPPFSRGQIEYQIVNNDPESLHPQFAVCGSGIMAGLSKSPDARPPTCAAVLAAVNHAVVTSVPGDKRAEVEQGAPLDEEARRRLLLTVRPPVHRVCFRFSIASTIVAAVLFSFCIIPAWIAGWFGGNEAWHDHEAHVALEQERLGRRHWNWERSEDAFRRAADDRMQVFIWLSTIPVLFWVVSGIYALTKKLTNRTLKLFEEQDWIAATKACLLSFGNDEWILYRRACCRLWGLGWVKRDFVCAQKLFKKACEKGNAEAFCALAWMSEHKTYGQSLAIGSGIANFHQAARMRNSMLVDCLESGCSLDSSDVLVEVRGMDELEFYNRLGMSDVGRKYKNCRFWLAVENLPFVIGLWSFACAVACVWGAFAYHGTCSQTCLLIFIWPLWEVGLHVFRYFKTRQIFDDGNLLANQYVMTWRRFFTFRNDRMLTFAQGVARLVKDGKIVADVERACDDFVASAERGNADAFAVLAWLAATGRTKRYDALQTAWLVREAKTRGSKLLAAKTKKG